jgi:hypothetical protein
MQSDYHKLKVFTVCIEEVLVDSIVDACNCKLVKFPLKYLELPISDKLSKATSMNQ